MIFVLGYSTFAYRLLKYHRDYLSLQELVGAFALSFLMSLTFGFYFFNICHCFTLGFAFVLTLLKVFFAKMKQLFSVLGDLTGKSVSTTKLNLVEFGRYRALYIKTLAFFFSLNRMYGRVFLANLLGLCPSNVIMTLWMILGLVDAENNLFFVFFIVYQYLFIFAIHLLLTFCSKHIHRPVKALIHMLVHTTKNGIGNIRSRIRLSNDIFALHTQNRYGFTYGNFGLISLAAFAKILRVCSLKLLLKLIVCLSRNQYLMLYGKIVMMSYKLIKSKYI